MLVNRFVIRRGGERERRGIPLVLRNELRRLFTYFVEHTALRDAAVFLAAANPSGLPTPPNNKVSFITTPRFNQFAMYLPAGAPPAQTLAVSQYLVGWISAFTKRGYSLTATDPNWRIQIETSASELETTIIAWAGTERVFSYGTDIIE